MEELHCILTGGKIEKRSSVAEQGWEISAKVAPKKRPSKFSQQDSHEMKTRIENYSLLRFSLLACLCHEWDVRYQLLTKPA